MIFFDSMFIGVIVGAILTLILQRAFSEKVIPSKTNDAVTYPISQYSRWLTPQYGEVFVTGTEIVRDTYLNGDPRCWVRITLKLPDGEMLYTHEEQFQKMNPTLIAHKHYRMLEETLNVLKEID